MKRNRDRGRIEQGVLQMNYIIHSNLYIAVSNKEKANYGVYSLWGELRIDSEMKEDNTTENILKGLSTMLVKS